MSSIVLRPIDIGFIPVDSSTNFPTISHTHKHPRKALGWLANNNNYSNKCCQPFQGAYDYSRLLRSTQTVKGTKWIWCTLNENECPFPRQFPLYSIFTKIRTSTWLMQMETATETVHFAWHFLKIPIRIMSQVQIRTPHRTKARKPFSWARFSRTTNDLENCLKIGKQKRSRSSRKEKRIWRILQFLWWFDDNADHVDSEENMLGSIFGVRFHCDQKLRNNHLHLKANDTRN